VKTGALGAIAGLVEQGFGEIDSGDLELGKFGGEAAGVEAWTATCLDKVTRLVASEYWLQCGGDLASVVGEKVFATESILTPTSIEEAYREPRVLDRRDVGVIRRRHRGANLLLVQRLRAQFQKFCHPAPPSFRWDKHIF